MSESKKRKGAEDMTLEEAIDMSAHLSNIHTGIIDQVADFMKYAADKVAEGDIDEYQKLSLALTDMNTHMEKIAATEGKALDKAVLMDLATSLTAMASLAIAALQFLGVGFDTIEMPTNGVVH